MRTSLLALLLSLPSFLSAQSAFRVNVTGPAQAPVMILIPGLASSGETWDATVARYKDRYQCHVLTLAGFAGVPRSPSTPGAPMLETVREQLAAYIRANQLVKPVIVGHSLGGFLALDLASKYPDLPGKLVIVDSYPSLAAIFQPEITAPEAKEQSKLTRQFMTQPGSQDAAKTSIRAMVAADADFERILAWSRASDYSAVVDAMVELYGADLREDIARIQSPTLVLATWIAYKQFTGKERVEANIRQEYAKLKGARIRMADTARHFIMYDDPQWFFAQIDEFLGAAK